MNKKRKNLVILVVVIIVLAAAWFYFTNNNSNIPAGWVEFKNDQYGISFYHPADMQAKFDERDDWDPIFDLPYYIREFLLMQNGEVVFDLDDFSIINAPLIVVSEKDIEINGGIIREEEHHSGNCHPVSDCETARFYFTHKGIEWEAWVVPYTHEEYEEKMRFYREILSTVTLY